MNNFKVKIQNRSGKPLNLVQNFINPQHTRTTHPRHLPQALRKNKDKK